MRQVEPVPKLRPIAGTSQVIARAGNNPVGGCADVLRGKHTLFGKGWHGVQHIDGGYQAIVTYATLHIGMP